jgi:CRISPR-associated protein Cmr6
MEYPVPHASAEAWRKHRSRSPLNPGLVFERFVPDWCDQPNVKRDGLQQVIDASKRVDGSLLAAWNRRWEAAVRAAGAEPFELQTEWRLIAGLGHKRSLEVGFTFDRYGFPVLPGSTLKGLARFTGLTAVSEEVGISALRDLDRLLSQDDDRKLHEQFARQGTGASETAERLVRSFRVIFGTTAAAGRAVFFDSIPSRPPRLELDIMNPHFPRYYTDTSGRAAPTDSQQPTPVYFLAVAPGTKFRFAVGWRGPQNGGDLVMHELARGWLITGLTGQGVGAKTSAGYGYFLLTAGVVPLSDH